MKQNILNEALTYLEPMIQLAQPHYWMGYHRILLTHKVYEGNEITSYHFKVNTRKHFYFTPGQHLCLSVEIDGKRYERYFSISSPIQDLKKHKRITISVKKQEEGVVTNCLANQSQPGDTLHIKTIGGDFFPSSLGPGAYIAAGSGITPMLSILESMSDSEIRNQSLVYCARGPKIPFLQRLRSLESRGLKLVTKDSNKDGRLTESEILQALATETTQAFVCGPNSFTSMVSNSLLKQGLKQSDIHTEHFHSLALTDQSEAPSAKLIWKAADGSEYASESQGLNLLEEAERAGRSPIFGCRSGVCHQCTAKKKHGRVKNLRTGEISDSGMEDIQLCISAAQTDVEIELRERSTQ